MIDGVLVKDVLIDPCYVVAEITVLHGRKAVSDGPTASSATVVLLADSGPMPPWQVGDSLRLTGLYGPLFFGRVAAIDLEHTLQSDGSVVGRFRITATGPVAALGLRPAGDVPWPQEPGTARAAHILDAANVVYEIDGVADAQVTPRDADSQTALALLTDLARSTSAAVFDNPQGFVVYQPMATRGTEAFPYRWEDFEETFTWAQFDPTLQWSGMGEGDWWSPESEFPVALPCEAVAWNPEWSTSNATVINHARIGYGVPPEGSEQAWTERTDAGSIDALGRRYFYLGSDLALLADAEALASRLVTVYGRPQWSMPEVTVLLDLLEDPGDVLRLTCGQHVSIAGMPAPSPSPDWTGIVEGWTYTQWAAGKGIRSQMLLAVSALPESFAIDRWSDYSPTFPWSSHPTWARWADLADLAAIGA